MPKKMALNPWLRQLLELKSSTQTHVALEIDAERQDGVDFVLHQLAWQPEHGHTGVSIPPGDESASKTVTLYPMRVRSWATVSPGDPATDHGHFLEVAAVGGQHALVTNIRGSGCSRPFPGRTCP